MSRLSKFAAVLLVALIVSPVTAPLSSCDLNDLVGPHHTALPSRGQDAASLLRGALTQAIPGPLHKALSKDDLFSAASRLPLRVTSLTPQRSARRPTRERTARSLALVLRI